MSVLRVLYVDDDDDIRTIASMALRIDPEIEVRAVASGREALDLLEGAGEGNADRQSSEEGWRPDVVLLDVMMPGMDGFAVQAAIRARSDMVGVKTIFMTARASRAGMEDYTASGADGVILKPFDALGLAGEVRAIVART